MKRLAAVALALLVPAAPPVCADIYEALAHFEEGRHEAAIQAFLPLAEAGDAEARYYLGRLYGDPHGPVHDDGEAVRWYRLAADQGHGAAQTNLGLAYETGRGVEADPARAAEWYHRAAEAGRSVAMYNLGLLYLDGRGVPREPALALSWWQRAAGQGHLAARFRLGTLYERGLGVGADPGRAARWYRRAARDGHGEAAARLASMYTAGHGVPRDPDKAARWLRRAASAGVEVSSPEPGFPATDPPAAAGPTADATPAIPPSAAGRAGLDASAPPAPPATPPSTATADASSPAIPPAATTAAEDSVPPGLQRLRRKAEQGDPEAAYRLGRAYALGEGTPTNPGAAARWYRTAAESGHGLAAYRLAFLHLRARLARQPDYVRAHVWFQEAAGREVGDAAKWLRKIEKRMSRSEIDEARQRHVRRTFD